MTLDEKIVEAAACAIFHAKPRNRIWDALPNEFKNQYRKQARAAITAFQAEETAWIANCCNCGRIIDTRETTQGGDEFGCELTDGRWVCSPECWEAVVEPATPNPPASP